MQNAAKLGVWRVMALSGVVANCNPGSDISVLLRRYQISATLIHLLELSQAGQLSKNDIVFRVAPLPLGWPFAFLQS